MTKFFIFYLVSLLKVDKIIGFTISKKRISHGDIDIFNIGLTKKEIRSNNLYMYLWGMGNLTNCKIGDKYVLSFPLSETLLDRNVLISFQNDNIIVENDWLGSIPIFYNSKEIIVSTLSLKTLKDKTIHPEGLNNYFEFGYSVLEQTPFMDVKFMRYYSELIINQNRIKIEHKSDPILQHRLFNKVEDEEVVLKRIQDYIINIEKKTKGEIILPTSGGYDTRLLNICINDKSRIRAFTYGISKEQSKSFEVVYAKKISEMLNIKWEQIHLGNFHNYINEWFKIYGFSTHLHGMYHIEFYKKILERNNFGKNATFLSGIIGDAWSGNVKLKKIEKESDLSILGYTHGINIDKSYLEDINNENTKIRLIFFKENSRHLENYKKRVIFSMRFKLCLLSYLTQIPEYFSFPVWTPFLNFDIAISMLNIKENRRKDRLWQKRFFVKNGLDLESMDLRVDKSNSLNFESLKNVILNPIDINIMEKYVNQKYLEKININLNKINTVDEIINYLFRYKYIRGICKILKIKNRSLDYLHSYYVIKSIEKSLKI